MSNKVASSLILSNLGNGGELQANPVSPSFTAKASQEVAADSQASSDANK